MSCSMPRAAASRPPVTVSLRFYARLNDFIARQRRHHDFEWSCAAEATVKHVIEAVGVPHTEIELILVNGASVGFAELLHNADRIAVYPHFASLELGPLRVLERCAPTVARFIADAHLGGLARLLRMAGFDTLYDNRRDDAEIEHMACRDKRIVLSRDRELLKRRSLACGCYVHALAPDEQLAEILGRLDLAGQVQPLTRCLECNAMLQPVAKAQVVARLPPGAAERQQRFSTCPVCQGVFWEGSHWRRMRQRLALAVEAAGGVLPPA
ncbi:MAG: Mut7-C RNAse domain-containing protein [Bacteroidota bacterium]